MSDRFELPAELTIYSAVEARDALLAWVAERNAKSAPLLLSAAAVETVDGSGLQLLAALSSMELGWRLVDASVAFVEACHLVGLSEWVEGLSTEGAT